MRPTLNGVQARFDIWFCLQLLINRPHIGYRCKPEVKMTMGLALWRMWRDGVVGKLRWYSISHSFRELSCCRRSISAHRCLRHMKNPYGNNNNNNNKYIIRILLRLRNSKYTSLRRIPRDRVRFTPRCIFWRRFAVTSYPGRLRAISLRCIWNQYSRAR